MPKKLKIGIVGCGAIGSSLAKVIARDLSRQARLAAVYDIDRGKAERLAQRLAVDSLERLIDKCDLVIEAASAKSSWKIAKCVLREGRDMMIMSVGGIVTHYKELLTLARRYNTSVYLPSGAISGVDALKAANRGKIKKVILTTRKNPLSFKGVRYLEDKGINIHKIKKDKVLFFGSAAEAVRHFPQNINVAAVLSIAGIGPERTQVKIIASPSTKKNIHEIQIQAEAGRIFTRTENILHPDNPKTSFLAVLSAIATLKQILEPVKIGT